MRRQASKATLTLDAARAFFEQQTPLPVRDALHIIHEAQAFMDQEENMVMVQGETIYVFGDIHGQFFDLLRLIDEVGLANLAENNVRMVFLGDYVGRVKYGISVYHHFLSCFQSMPIAALLHTARGNVFCVHGGISPHLMDLRAIAKVDRRREIPTEGPLCDLLWADPVSSDDVDQTNLSWASNDVRGCSYYFNAAALFTFLEKNLLLAVVRAHEYEEEGFMFYFQSEEFRALDKRRDQSMPPLITVFSSPNYCDQLGNQAGYLVLHTDPFEWELKQVTPTNHPAPALIVDERGSDILKQFNRTLPFLPASKDFFEEIVYLASREINKGDSSQQTKTTLMRMESRDAMETTNHMERKRRQTSEMHPQAIRRVLDDEASKWSQSEEEQLQVYTEDAIETRHRRLSNPDNTSSEEDRSQILTSQELEMMKLMFSLLDTDGSMTLSAAKVSQFIYNALGEKISDEIADIYLKALDYDLDGIVDFADILSWAAVMKLKHEQRYSFAAEWRRWMNMIRVATGKADLFQACMWLVLGCLLRDAYASQQKRLIKYRAVHVVGSISVIIYLLDMLHIRTNHTRMRYVFIWNCIRRWISIARSKLLMS